MLFRSLRQQVEPRLLSPFLVGCVLSEIPALMAVMLATQHAPVYLRMGLGGLSLFSIAFRFPSQHSYFGPLAGD